MSWKKTTIISATILIGALTVMSVIFFTEPKAERSDISKQTAMLVEVVKAQKGTYNPIISATGTVRPSQEILLGARIEGQVVYLSPDFVPGGYVDKGDILLQVDSTDYINDLTDAESSLEQARSELQRELGLQEAAKREYSLLDDTLSKANKALVLREPQLRSVKARVSSAQTAVNQAKVNLQRTTIRSPFEGHIIYRNVNIGSLVSPGQNLGQLVGNKIYWVETAVPLNRLKWLQFEEDGVSSPVEIRSKTAWGEGKTREGRLFKMLGSLEDQTRMARVLVEVSDPLSRQKANVDKPRLVIGSFVQTNIQGKAIEGVVKINRDYIRSNETAWVMQGDTLDIRELEVVFQDADHAYVAAGLEEGDDIVTTNLANVTEGAPLRLKDEEQASTANGGL